MHLMQPQWVAWRDLHESGSQQAPMVGEHAFARMLHQGVMAIGHRHIHKYSMQLCNGNVTRWIPVMLQLSPVLPPHPRAPLSVPVQER